MQEVLVLFFFFKVWDGGSNSVESSEKNFQVSEGKRVQGMFETGSVQC